MFALIALASASAIALPQVNTERVFQAVNRTITNSGDLDFSAEVLLVFDQEGRVLDCQTQHARGSAESLKRLCEEMRRVRAKPARDRNGAPAHGIVGTRVAVDPKRESDQGMIVNHSDLELSLPDMGIKGMIHTFVEVGADGRIDYCEVRAGPDGSDDGDWQQVCALLKDAPVGTIKGSKEASVPYVRSIKVLVNG